MKNVPRKDFDGRQTQRTSDRNSLGDGKKGQYGQENRPTVALFTANVAQLTNVESSRREEER